MIQRGSFLRSSQNNSQLSLYSHTSSGSAGNSSHYDGPRRTRYSSSDQASRSVSGQGYLTTRRTAQISKAAQSKAMNTFPLRREKSEGQVSDHDAVEGVNGASNDLESYLSSFGRSSEVGRKAPGDKHLPRGSELDWVKLMESEQKQTHDTQLEHDEDHNASTFLKKSTRLGVADSPLKLSDKGYHHQRRNKMLSPEIKYDIVDENSSPNVSDIVMTDSLNGSSTHDPMVTNHPMQAHTRNVLRAASDQSVADGSNVKVASDLLSSSDSDVSYSPDKDKTHLVAMRDKGTELRQSDDSVSMSEEKTLSESFDFKQNIMSSIDQLEAIIVDDTHQHSEASSSFEQNLHDVHSLRELEELEDPPSHGAKDVSSVQGKGISSTSVELEQSPIPPSQQKARPSGFKFSATTTTVLDNTSTNNHPHETVSYGSDEFESESVSEAESLDSSAEEVVEEGSVATQQHRDRPETATSHDGTVELQRSSGSGTDVHESERHSELSYSSFSEAEQKNKSELTESQQMEQLASDVHPPNSFEQHSEPSKPTAAVDAQDACIQTEPLSDLPDTQPTFTGYPAVTSQHHYGKEYLDPSPILPHVIPADALEVVMGYTPSVLALTDMLRTQLSITRNLVAHSRQLAANVSSNISSNYHYTTLEETKQYIARHRPKLLCFDEARKLVKLEQ